MRIKEAEVFLMKDNIEDLRPLYLSKTLAEIADELEELLIKKEKENTYLPKGKIYVSPGMRKTQFYMADNSNVNHKQYMSRLLESVAKRYIQHEYNEKVINALKWDISKLRDYIRKSQKKGVASCSTLMSRTKRPYYVPITLSDREYINKWGEENYPTKGFLQGDVLFETSFGLRVRSKSEILIAEALKKRQVPFRYEFPVKIKNRIFYPDFFCLNVRTRRVFIWEHFGLIDDADYRSGTFEKMAAYEESGYVIGKNLIVTAEEARHPLNAKTIDVKIETFLL